MPHVVAARHNFYRTLLSFGLALYELSSRAATTSIPIIGGVGIIGVLLVGSFLIPVVYVEYLDELDLFEGVRRSFLLKIGILTAVVAIPMALVLERLGHAGAGALIPAMLTGLIEEAAKLLVVWWILGRTRYRFELDGVIIGAAAGMGFGAFETLAYGLKALIQGSIPDLLATLGARMVLSPFGHGTWTAAICAVIWRERFTGQGRLDWRVLTAYLVSSGLHAAWDLQPWRGFGGLAWLLAVGWVGVVVLGLRVHEALDQEEAFEPHNAPHPADAESAHVLAGQAGDADTAGFEQPRRVRPAQPPHTVQSRAKLASGIALLAVALGVWELGLILVDPHSLLLLVIVIGGVALSSRTLLARRYWANLTGPLDPFPMTGKRVHNRRHRK
jgi:RsiW-degrading membrane proteinase PrsW (M82 family)